MLRVLELILCSKHHKQNTFLYKRKSDEKSDENGLEASGQVHASTANFPVGHSTQYCLL